MTKNRWLLRRQSSAHPLQFLLFHFSCTYINIISRDHISKLKCRNMLFSSKNVLNFWNCCLRYSFHQLDWSAVRGEWHQLIGSYIPFPPLCQLAWSVVRGGWHQLIAYHTTFPLWCQLTWSVVRGKWHQLIASHTTFSPRCQLAWVHSSQTPDHKRVDNTLNKQYQLHIHAH